MMALPFYVVAAQEAGIDLERVAVLLGAQTAGTLAGNPLWGWWSDRRGKRSLLQGVAALRTLPPLGVLAMGALSLQMPTGQLTLFIATFFVLGALSSGVTIGVLGFLMEISPDDRRPAYSGYFNALTAPAYLLPLVGGVLVARFGAEAALAISLVGAIAQCWLISVMPTAD